MVDRIEPTLTCPNCSHEIELTESLAGPLLADMRREHAEALASQKAEVEATARAAAEAAQAEKLEAMAAEAEAQRLRLEASEKRVAEARAAEKAALEKEQALKDREAELEVEVAKKLALERRAQEEKLRVLITTQMAEAQAEKDEAANLRLAEKDQQMETLKRQIEVLKQKSDKGSQQLQGEALEVALEERLGQAFPLDQLTPVGKGVRGADCLQQVQGAGAIIWEAKRAQNWSKDWPAKLKEDQRREGAEIAVLVSVVLPEGVDTFAEHEGVWVTSPRFAVALAGVLRQGLLATAQAERRKEGQAEKTELLYDYLTGTGFRQRVEALAETYEAMRKSLDQERASMQRIWSARDKQIVRMLDATTGMYGDIQGIAGASLPDIEAFALPSPDDEL
ncbi:MAG: DUF2130 domain-containing protein [Pseudomonadota bacterium]